MYFEILNNNINSYDRKNKKQMDSIIQTCTILESLLKLPLSFPEVRNDTINSLMNSNKNYKNKHGIKISLSHFLFKLIINKFF